MPDQESTSAPADDFDDPQEVPATGTPAPASEGDQLAEAGRRALEQERKARRDAERKLRDLVQRDMSDTERTTAQLAETTAERDQLRMELTRMRLAARHGVAEGDLELLTGDEATMEKLAQRLGRPVQEETPRLVDVGQGARGNGQAGPMDMNQFIRRAATGRG